MIRTENWNGYEIRFVWHNDDWWAVARDVAHALGYRYASHMFRLVEKEERISIRLTDGNNRRGNPNVTIISEFGIYDAIWGSERPEAKEFKKWVKQILKHLRQATGLEGFQIFRMLDKEHQKEAMEKLRASLRRPTRVDYIKANTIANKAVANMFGLPKMVKKEAMTPEMLVARQQILEDTVDLMGVADKFGLDLSVSEEIYRKYAGPRSPG